jgi:hypothetical protein
LGALLLVGVVQSEAPRHAQQAMVVLEQFLPLSFPCEMSDVLNLLDGSTELANKSALGTFEHLSEHILTELTS